MKDTNVTIELPRIIAEDLYDFLGHVSAWDVSTLMDEDADVESVHDSNFYVWNELRDKLRKCNRVWEFKNGEYLRQVDEYKIGHVCFGSPLKDMIKGPIKMRVVNDTGRVDPYMEKQDISGDYWKHMAVGLSLDTTGRFHFEDGFMVLDIDQHVTDD